MIIEDQIAKDIVYGDYVKIWYEDGDSSIVKIDEKNEHLLYLQTIEPLDVTIKTLLNTKNFIQILGNQGYEDNGENWFVCPLCFESEYTDLTPCLYVIISQDVYDDFCFIGAGIGEYKLNKWSGVTTLNQLFPFKNNYGCNFHELQHALRPYGIELDLDIDRVKSKI